MRKRRKDDQPKRTRDLIDNGAMEMLLRESIFLERVWRKLMGARTQRGDYFSCAQKRWIE
jgi:hypothetical protein